MFSELRSFLDKKNIINLLIVGILILGIPLAVQLVKQQQLIKSRADVVPVEVVEDGTRVVKRVINGRERLVATTQTVTVRLRTPAEFSSTSQTTNFGIGTVYAGHTAGTEGWYCDNNQIWHDRPDGGHELWEDCGTNKTCTPIPRPAGSSYTQDAECKANSTSTPSEGQDCSDANAAKNCGVSNNLYCRNFDSSSYNWWSLSTVNSKCQNKQAKIAQCGGTTSYCWSDGRWGSRPEAQENQACNVSDGCDEWDVAGVGKLICRAFNNDGNYKWLLSDTVNAKCSSGEAQTAQCGGETKDWCRDDGKWTTTSPTSGGTGNPSCFLSNIPTAPIKVGEEFTATFRLSREPSGSERAVVHWGTADTENIVIPPETQDNVQKITRTDGGAQYNIKHKYASPGTYTITASLDYGNKSICSNINSAERQKQVTVTTATGPACPDRVKVDGCVGAGGKTGTQWCTRGDTSGCTEEQKGCFDALTGGTKGACKVEAARPGTCDPIVRKDCKMVDGRDGQRTCNPAGDQCGRTIEECGACTPISGAAPSAERVVKFKISDDPTSWDSKPEFPFTGDGMTFDFPFLNTTPGERLIFVRFIGSNGRTVDKQTSVLMVGPDPVITNLGCNVDVQNNSLIFTALGFNFGTRDFERSSLSADGTPLEIREWISLTPGPQTPGPQAGRVIARLLSPPDVALGHTYVVTLTRGDGVRTTSTCNVGTTTVAFSTKMQCRVPGQFSANNVDVKIFGTGPNPILRQKINIDKDGNPQGFTPKLELNKIYTLIIKPPGTLAKRQVFQTGSGGTVNLEPITLPVGDIGPRESPDGVVNAIDASELKRQWSLVSDVVRTGDFNQDSRINSLDYSCLIKNINASDELFTLSTLSTATPPASPSATLTSTPTSSGIIIKGDETCVSNTQEALNLLQVKAPLHYSIVTKYIGIIECANQGSGMYAWESPPRFQVGKATYNAGVIWYAGVIAHDSCHSKQYHDYLLTNKATSVPNEAWTGKEAERQCLDVQYDALTKIGAAQDTLDWVKNSINSGYWGVEYSNRWW